MTGDGGLVEVQATAERTPLSRANLDALLALAQGGIESLKAIQAAAVGGVTRGAAARHPQRAQAARVRRGCCRGLELEPLPDDVETPPEDGDDLRRQRADQGARGRRGDRPRRDRRRLGHRGRGARRPPGRAHRALRRPGRHRRARTWPSFAQRGPARAAALALRVRDRRTSTPTARRRCSTGACAGTMAAERAGTRGFGYDPVFVPDGERRTMAELRRRREGRDLPPRACRARAAGVARSVSGAAPPRRRARERTRARARSRSSRTRS